MQKEYATILEDATDEIVEKKSRFIGYVRHVESEEEAAAFLMKIRKQDYDARHHCYAYVVGQEQPVFRFSDDGEPGGTAGKPILEVIQGKNLSDICVVVTRYFGGTLLGTGGLVRAYTDAANACIRAAKVVVKQLVSPLKIEIAYTDLGKVQYILAQEGITPADIQYGEQVTLMTEIPVDQTGQLQKKITEATAARAVLERQDPVFALRQEEV